ncbi:MAG: DUF4265 domain-containing protein [Gemmatimonadaceae bacterium]
MQPQQVSLRDAAQEKIGFRLVRDEDGYPPADWEHLWARAVGDDQYVIDNTPFFVRGISFGDVVAAERESGQLVFRQLVQPSPHSTLRVILFRKDLVVRLRQRMRELGCATELSHVPGLIAVDVPPGVSLESVRQVLDVGEKAGDWEYEEAAVRAPP